MAYQFTNKGSTPTVQTAGFYQTGGATPKAAALSSAATPGWLNTLNNVTTMAKPSPQTTTIGQSKIPAQKTTQVAKPVATTPTVDPKAGSYDAQTGLLTAKGKSLGLPEVNAVKTGSTAPALTPATTPANPTTFPGIVGAGVNTSMTAANQGAGNVESGSNILKTTAATPNAAATEASKGLLNIAKYGSPAVAKANEELLKFRQESPFVKAAQFNPNVAANVASGRAAIIGNTLAEREAALAQNVANALGQQGQQITAANEAGGLGLTGRGQDISAGSAVANAGLSGLSTGLSGLNAAASQAAPQGYGLTTQPYNPLTDTFSGGGASGALNRAIQAGNINTAQNFAQDYQTGLAKLRNADAIQGQIVQTLASNPKLNSTPISAFTNLNQFLAGQASDPSQQQLAQQVANYIATLGLDTASVANIASQQKGTLAQLLDSLRATAQARVDSVNPANLTNSGSGLNVTSQSILAKYGIK